MVERGTGEFYGNPEARALVQEAPGSSGITINLVGATIPEAARSILGDTLGLNYVVSDKLKGSITLQTSRPIPRAALLEVFETLLRGEGAAIVVQQGLYRIVPAEEAIANAPLRGKGVNYRRLAGVSSIVIPLQYVAAGEMERIAKSIAPQSSILRTDTARNLLVVSGTRGELDAIVDAVSIFDVDWMRGMSFGIYPVESGDPYAIAQELDAIFANDQESSGKGVIRFIPNKRLKAILAISSRPQFLSKAESWLRRIETVGRGAERQVHVYRIQHRPAGELASVLRRVYAAQELGTASPAAPRQQAADTPTTAIQPDTLTPRPFATPGMGQGAGLPSPEITPAQGLPTATVDAAGQAGTAADLRAGVLAGSVPDERGPGIGIVADDSNNSLIITATTSEYARIRRILERIDVLPTQVLLEATIAEVRLNDELRMGLRWFFQSGKHQFKFTDSVLGSVTPVFPGFSHFFNTPNVQVVLNALSTITDVNIVSSPTLTVIDNKRATLQVGDEVPVPTAQAVGVITPNAPIVNAIAYRSTGIILNITPRVSENGRILLEIEQEASDVVPSPLGVGDTVNNPPTIQQRRVKTIVSVNDGEGIVLGGLIQDRATRSRDQVPLLGEIPVVGNIFKHKNDDIRRTELLIAITPRVIRDSGQIRAITDEFRDKLNMSTRPQRQAPPDRKEQIDRVLR